MRIRAILQALVGILFVSLPLVAAQERPFTVGILLLQDEPSSYTTLVQEAGSFYASRFNVPSTAYATHLQAILTLQKRLDRQERIATAYASKDEQALGEAQRMDVEIGTTVAEQLPVEYRKIPLEKGYPALLARYPAARSWFSAKEDLDALVMIQTTQVASKERIRLYWYDRFYQSTTPIFDQIVEEGDPLMVQKAVGSALLAQSAGPEYALLIVEGASSSVRIEANNELLLPQQGKVLLPFGTYNLFITKEGYLPIEKELVIEASSIQTIALAFERVAMEDMTLYSPQGEVSWFADGVFLGRTSSLRISSSLVPVVVVAQKEGFSPKTLQIQSPSSEIALSLEPTWLASSSLLAEKQNSFYTSLRNSMLLFGLYVASSTLSQTFAQANPLWQPLQVATSGLALVSTLHTIMNLASYTSLASAGVR